MTDRAQRSPRAWRHEQALLDAALDELVVGGWACLVPARVAQRAGRSITPVRTRFGDRSGLAVAIWNNRVGAPLRDALARITAALESSDGDLERGLQHSLTPFVAPIPTLQAALELLVASTYDPALAAAVRSTLDADFDAWFTPRANGTTASQGAQRATLVSAALGLALSAPLVSGQRVDLGREVSALAQAIRNPSRPSRLPVKGAEHLDRGFEFDTGDVITDAILRATLETVGEIGFEAGTIERIANRSGYAQGAIFSRYPSKIALFLDGIAQYTSATTLRNAEMMQRIVARTSVGIAEAFYIRESMRQGRQSQRVVLLEQLRLTRTSEEIARAFTSAIEPTVQRIRANLPGSTAQKSAAIRMSMARGNGPTLLAAIAPTTWNLPYDVVTVPLQTFQEA